jgi:hypothetical protein
LCATLATAANRPRTDHDALGNAATAAHKRAAGHQYPQHPFATLAGLAETGKPVLVPANSFAEFSRCPD